MDGTPFSRSRLTGARSLIRRADGQSLIELVVVMAVMGLIIGISATLFSSVSRAETDQIARLTAQDAARTALVRMQKDIHCAQGTPAVTTNAYGGNTLSLSVSSTACPNVTTLALGVKWCTIPYPGSTTRFRLYRETDGECDGAGATLLADYFTVAALWSVPSCATGRQPTVAISMPVNTDAVGSPARTSTLNSSVALRNASPC